jgi:hypothetical protein
MLQELISFATGATCVVVAHQLVTKVMRKRGEKRSRQYFQEDLKDYEIVKIYTTKDQSGKELNWYSFVNPLRLPAARAIAGEVAMKQAEMNIDRETLISFITGMKDSANKGKITELFADLMNLEQRVNYACEEETLLSLACVYFLTEGEDPRTISEGVQARKREIMKTDDNARAFFLTSAFKLTNTLSDISAVDILSYLSSQKRPKGSIVSTSGEPTLTPEQKTKGIFSGKFRSSSTPSTNKT